MKFQLEPGFTSVPFRFEFGDNREQFVHCVGGALTLRPGAMPIRALSLGEDSRSVVVFAPPHRFKAGPKSKPDLRGRLDAVTWRDELREALAECFRVLEPGGVLILKWKESQIPVGEVLALTDQKPFMGHHNAKPSRTHWITFRKEAAE